MNAGGTLKEKIFYAAIITHKKRRGSSPWLSTASGLMGSRASPWHCALWPGWVRELSTACLNFCAHSGRSRTLVLQASVIQEYHQADFGQIWFHKSEDQCLDRHQSLSCADGSLD